MPELVAIGFVENGIVVHEGDSLALGLRSTLAGIVVIFGFAVFRLAFRGLLAEEPHKPAHPLGDKREMPGPKPERKHQNQHESDNQNQERSQARDLPEHGNRDILAKELPHDTAVHHHHVATHLGIAIIL